MEANTAQADVEQVALTGEIARVRYHDATSGFTSLIVRDTRGDRSRAIGVLQSEPSVGERLRLLGRWTEHGEFARVYEFHRFTVQPPTDDDGRIEFLVQQARMSPRHARAAVEHFGESVVDLIASQPERLAEVPGIDLETAQTAGRRYVSHHRDQQMAVLMEQHGLPPHLLERYAARIERGNDPGRDVRQNPYRLTITFPEAPFDAIDALAAEVGARNHPERPVAIVCDLLRKRARRGDTRVGLTDVADELLRKCGEAYTLHQIHQLVAPLLEDHHVVMGEHHLARVDLVDAERRLARQTARLAHHGRGYDVDPKRLDRLLPADLPDTHRAALRRALVEGMGLIDCTIDDCVGLGRTLEALATRLRLDTATVCDCPRRRSTYQQITGRAPRRVRELLDWNEGQQPAHDRTWPIEATAMIVLDGDRHDTHTLARLLEGAAIGTLVVLLGDTLALPPTGVGTPFRTLHAHPGLPRADARTNTDAGGDTTHLPGLRAALAHGAPVRFSPTGTRSLKFITLARNEVGTAAVCLHDHLARRGYNPTQIRLHAAQSAAHRAALNDRLQAHLNPDGEPVGETPVRVGDPALLPIDAPEIPAGTALQVVGIEPGLRALVECADGHRRLLERSATQRLQRAYVLHPAIAAGSTAPVVVLIAPPGHAALINRSVLYHLAHSASEKLFVLGERETLERASTQAPRHRYTGLEPAVTAALSHMAEQTEEARTA